MKQNDPQEIEVLSVEETKTRVLECILNCEVDSSHALDQDDIFERWPKVNENIVESLYEMRAIPKDNDIPSGRSQLIVCRYHEGNELLGGMFFADKRNRKNLLDALPGTPREIVMDRQYFGVYAWKDGSVFFCRSYGAGMIGSNFVQIEEINKKQLKFVNTLINAWLE